VCISFNKKCGPPNTANRSKCLGIKHISPLGISGIQPETINSMKNSRGTLGHCGFQLSLATGIAVPEALVVEVAAPRFHLNSTKKHGDLNGT